jgi:DNA-binding NarL/FixJ family response regulator
VTRLRILLADDHETVRTGLRVILNAQADMEVVGEAADGQAVIQKTEELQPDVVLMDVSMPRLNGLQATKALRERVPAVKILTLTRHGDVAYLHQLLEAGASGYVLKQSRAAEVLQAIRAVASGGTYIDSAMTADALAAPVRAVAAARGGTVLPSLSPREADTLRFVARGYSNKEIAAQLNVSVKTIETHKGNAMHKLGMRNRIDIVRYAMLQGWLDET